MILFLLALLPLECVQTDRYDLGEVSHVYTESGDHQFTQVIFWRWNGERFECQAWRMLRNPNQHPTRCGSGYKAVWFDDGVFRSVRFSDRRETWLMTDPELDDRKILPQDKRAGLSRLPGNSILVR